MLGAAFAAAATAATTGSAWPGLVAGVFAAMALSLVHSYACITHNGDQVFVCGMALNILVCGLTPVLGFAWFREGGQTPLLGGGARRLHRPAGGCRPRTRSGHRSDLQ